ncbi:putative oxidoreductase [Lachnellula occidentalis]|uniref:Putative oxidoreductase n=1 Tax=Lachnellula occidentalis TaxID=215460 RepID=A0A8H8S5K1_9HELO|nr:putative oxidoreductase [Lachnellula occidentalis]
MPTWFVTGGSSGLGLEVAKAALAAGDNVTVTSRDANRLKELKDLGAHTISLDITGPEEGIVKVVDEVHQKYGSIDVLLNNAGYILEGAVEEVSDAEAKEHFNVNVFAQLSVTRAVLPHMRKQKSGVIGNMGSIAGWEGGVGCGLYCASKFAVVGLSEALREEVKSFGIQVVVIEPGYFRTNFLSAGHKVAAQKVIEELKPVVDPLRGIFAAYDHQQPGDPAKAGKVIVEALTGKGPFAGKELPPRLALGSDAFGFIGAVLEKEKKSLEEWKAVTMTTDH